MKKVLLDTAGVALWVGISATITYLLTSLLDKPELAPYYGVLNVLLYAAKNLKK